MSAKVTGRCCDVELKCEVCKETKSWAFISSVRTARRWSERCGWTTKRVGGRIVDLCPKHRGTSK